MTRRLSGPPAWLKKDATAVARELAAQSAYLSHVRLAQYAEDRFEQLMNAHYQGSWPDAWAHYQLVYEEALINAYDAAAARA